MDNPMDVLASPAKKQKQQLPEYDENRRSYAAVVRASLYQMTDMAPKAEAASLPTKIETPRTAIVVEVDSGRSRSKNYAKKSYQQQLVDVQPYLRQLDEYLELEVKYKGSVQPSTAQVSPMSASNIIEAGTITSGLRDGSAHILRCLKVWYDLPSDIFFNAVNCIDRFLSKMRAQQKHLSCIAVASFHLASEEYRRLQDEQAKLAEPAKTCPTYGVPLIAVPDPSDLVTISQSRCSSSDLLRMQLILANKLEVNHAAGPGLPVTALGFLRTMFSVCRAASVQHGLTNLLPDALPDQLVHQLEILACDSLTLEYRPAEVALSLLATEFRRRGSEALIGFITELQKYCNISAGSFASCLDVVTNQLDKYNRESSVAHRQRLVWKLSHRTLRHLRPTDKLRATLPTIKESSNLQRIRSASNGSNESLESISMCSEGLCESDRDMEIEEEEEEEEDQE